MMYKAHTVAKPDQKPPNIQGSSYTGCRIRDEYLDRTKLGNWRGGIAHKKIRSSKMSDDVLYELVIKELIFPIGSRICLLLLAL